MSTFSSNIVIDDKEVRETLNRIADGVPDGVMGRVYSRGAIQRGRRYEHYVMSRQRQATIHKGRWQTEESIAEDNADKVSDAIAGSVEGLLKGNQKNLKRGVDEGLDILLNEAKRYPAPPPNSRYTRTYTLQRSWAKENKL